MDDYICIAFTGHNFGLAPAQSMALVYSIPIDLLNMAVL